MTFDYTSRIGRLRTGMAERDISTTLLSVGADLRYVLGYEAVYTERLTMAVIPPEGDITLIVPVLEVPRFTPVSGVVVRGWTELESPLGLVADLLGSVGEGTIAFGDHTWARFLMELQDLMAGRGMATARFVPATPVLSTLRVRKDAAELDRLRSAADAADRVAGRLAMERFSGRTERDIAHWISAALIEEGCEVAAFAIVASGPNAASPHHEPTARVIAVGDTVVCDFGGTIDGYSSDTTRTFSVGEPSSEVAAAHAVLYEAQQTGVDTAGPGVPCEEVDRATRKVIDDAGYGEHFIHRTGHGIGLEVHEDPYMVEGNETPLEPGMAFSVEPGIYVAGSWGMRIEDIAICTETAGERLNLSSRALVVVD